MSTTPPLKDAKDVFVHLGKDALHNAPVEDWHVPERPEAQQEPDSVAYCSSAVTIFDLLETPPNPQDTLLGDRLLCRGGAMLFVGPSGSGKSSSSMQQDICWALGREAFGIIPERPLRILTIQAENDGGDLHEMASGVVHGVANILTEEERGMLKGNLHYLTVTAAMGNKFLLRLA